MRKYAKLAGSGAIAAAVAFTPLWEGMDSVAKRDMIGTGHPITYCNGLTSVDGSVKVGQRFTKAECDKRLAIALPKYWDQIANCLDVPGLPDKTAGSLLDASFNAGPGAVCRSPMVTQINAGNLRAGCYAFKGWYVRSDGKVRTGLIDRRDGEDYGDKRLSEKGLCLQGLAEGTSTGDPFTHAAKLINSRRPEITSVAVEVVAPTVAAPKPHKRPAPKPLPVCTHFLWFKSCTINGKPV